MRKYIIDLFKKGIFPFEGNVFKIKEEKSEGKVEMSINDGIIFIKKTQGT